MAEASNSEEATSYLKALKERVEQGLLTLDFPAEPAELYAPVRYVLEGGGKRVRPLLTLLAAEAFGGDDTLKQAVPAALAMEVFHNFTLVHDDIMDHADERRGRATVHVRWDEPTAILSGDLMMGLAYDLLAQVETDRTAEVIRIFHKMVARLCEGQAMDMAFEKRSDVSVFEYVDMIERKTAALLEAALEIGALIGGADAEARENIAHAGRDLGRAFQIQDDLLDLTADDAKWGKTIGGDLLEGKKTFLLLRALECAEGQEHSWFARIVKNGGLDASAVPEARARMEVLGVLQEAGEAVEENYRAGLARLESLPVSRATNMVRSMVDGLLRRAR